MVQLPKSGLVRGYEKPIHDICAIYFPVHVGSYDHHPIFTMEEFSKRLTPTWKHQPIVKNVEFSTHTVDASNPATQN